MRKSYLLVILLGMFGTGSLVAQQNLITNGEVEEWTTSSYLRPTGYTLNTKARSTGFCTKSGLGEGYGGAGYAVRLKTRGIKESGSTTKNLTGGSCYLQTAEFSYPEVDQGEEACYELSFMGKGSGKLGDMSHHLSTASTSLPYQTYVTSDDWVKYAASYVITPTETTVSYVRVKIYDVKSEYFYVDNLQYVKLPNDLATIRSIGFAEEKDPTKPNDLPLGSYLPGFDPEVLDYQVNLWFGTDTVPALLIDPMNKLATVTTNYNEIKNFSPGETSKELVITVTAKDGSNTKEYKIKFDRSNYVVGGLSKGTHTTPALEGIAMVSNLDMSAVDNCNRTLGAYSFKPSSVDESETGTYLVTVPLVNGAKEISFNTGYYGTEASATYLSEAIAAGTEFAIAVSVSEDGSENYQFVDEHIIDLTKSEWVNVKFDIDSPSPNTRVKIEYVKKNTEDKTLQFLLDDIVITPYNQSSSIDRNLNSAQESLQVYAQNGAIVIEEQAPYQVYSIGGQLVATGINQSDKIIVSVQKGLYIVKVLDRKKKIIVQ